MSVHVFEKIEGNLRLRIFQDSDVRNPREEFDHVASFIMFHRRYNFGDKNISALEGLEEITPETVAEFCKREDVTALPVYMIDHSGLSVSTGSFGCPWDSGQIGFIFVTDEKLKQEGIDLDRAEEILKSEVKELDQWLTGDVYGFVVERRAECDSCKHVEWEHVDSCWGFYGYVEAEQEGLSVLKSCVKENK